MHDPQVSQDTNQDTPEDALQLATRMARGELSAREALAQTLARVERLNPRLNAIASLAPELGYERAEQLDAERAQHVDARPRWFVVERAAGQQGFVRRVVAWRFESNHLDQRLVRR